MPLFTHKSSSAKLKRVQVKEDSDKNIIRQRHHDCRIRCRHPAVYASATANMLVDATFCSSWWRSNGSFLSYGSRHYSPLNIRIEPLLPVWSQCGQAIKELGLLHALWPEIVAAIQWKEVQTWRLESAKPATWYSDSTSTIGTLFYLYFLPLPTAAKYFFYNHDGRQTWEFDLELKKGNSVHHYVVDSMQSWGGDRLVDRRDIVFPPKSAWAVIFLWQSRARLVSLWPILVSIYIDARIALSGDFENSIV